MWIVQPTELKQLGISDTTVMHVSTSAIDYLERLVSEMTCYVSSWTLNPTLSLTHNSDASRPAKDINRSRHKQEELSRD